MQYSPSGITGLDEILGNGLPAPSTIFVAGTAGTGKTAFVLQALSYAAKKGEAVAYIPITSQSEERLRLFLSTYPVFDEKIHIHTVDRSSAEKDPLTALLDIGNSLAQINPTRIAIDPITPLGFGFPELEKRRFMYSVDSMLHEWKAITFVVGELVRDEVHGSVISHIADGILYLSREVAGLRTVRRMEILKMRGVPRAENTGVFQFKLGSGGMTVFQELKVAGVPAPMLDTRMSTGIEGLDRMTGGGIPQGTTMLVCGSTGTGKTVLGMQFIYTGLRKGENCLVVSFEERPDQLIAEAKAFGWDLDTYLKGGQLQFIYTKPETLDTDDHASAIASIIEGKQIKRVMFDSITDLEAGLSDAIAARGYVQKLGEYFKSRGATCLFTADSAAGDSARPSCRVSFIADAVINLGYRDIDMELRRTISIVKLRGCDFDRKTREFAITARGIEIAAREKRFGIQKFLM
ncbi:MAG TPA: circadian clock protein KaiC [Candidatus Methanoperedenaceae archaeon]|nr:circadian clock protein KaiC [Candidatus Methanoperedenaceae archaeon]